MKLKILIHAEEEGGFLAEVPGAARVRQRGRDARRGAGEYPRSGRGWLEVASEREPAEQPTFVQEIEL